PRYTRGRGGGRDRAGLLLLPRRDRAHRRLPVRRGRQLPGRECHADADGGRAVRHGAGRRYPQVRAAGAAYRLHLLGHRRGVRLDRLHRHCRHLPGDHRSGADQAARRGKQFCHSRRRGSGNSVRPSGTHQHGGERADRAVEGHDLAVHQLWRKLHAGAVGRHGTAARLYPAEPVSEALALCREMERGVLDSM
ncbi:MAG: Cell division protein FtsW, partial [uncultured Sphingomonas sp.]